MQSLVAFTAALQSPSLHRLEDLLPYQELLGKYLELSFHSPTLGFKNMRTHINHVQRMKQCDVFLSSFLLFLLLLLL
jgi:hypothetical protein